MGFFPPSRSQKSGSSTLTQSLWQQPCVFWRPASCSWLQNSEISKCQDVHFCNFENSFPTSTLMSCLIIYILWINLMSFLFQVTFTRLPTLVMMMTNQNFPLQCHWKREILSSSSLAPSRTSFWWMSRRTYHPSCPVRLVHTILCRDLTALHHWDLWYEALVQQETRARMLSLNMVTSCSRISGPSWMWCLLDIIHLPNPDRHWEWFVW